MPGLPTVSTRQLASGVDVPVSALRAELADWIERVRRGEEVVVTDRGTPVARLIAVDTAPMLERLTRDAQFILGGTPAEFAQFLRDQDRQWRPILSKLDVQNQ